MQVTISWHSRASSTPQAGIPITLPPIRESWERLSHSPLAHRMDESLRSAEGVIWEFAGQQAPSASELGALTGALQHSLSRQAGWLAHLTSSELQNLRAAAGSARAQLSNSHAQEAAAAALRSAAQQAQRAVGEGVGQVQATAERLHSLLQVQLHRAQLQQVAAVHLKAAASQLARLTLDTVGPLQATLRSVTQQAGVQARGAGAAAAQHGIAAQELAMHLLDISAQHLANLQAAISAAQRGVAAARPASHVQTGFEALQHQAARLTTKLSASAQLPQVSVALPSMQLPSMQLPSTGE
jgi:hypothetical protein